MERRKELKDRHSKKEMNK
jgi:hypothetical protein